MVSGKANLRLNSHSNIYQSYTHGEDNKLVLQSICKMKPILILQDCCRVVYKLYKLLGIIQLNIIAVNKDVHRWQYFSEMLYNHITVKYVFFEKTHDKTNLRSLECYKFRTKKKLVIWFIYKNIFKIHLYIDF